MKNSITKISLAKIRFAFIGDLILVFICNQLIDYKIVDNLSIRLLMITLIIIAIALMFIMLIKSRGGPEVISNIFPERVVKDNFTDSYAKVSAKVQANKTQH